MNEQVPSIASAQNNVLTITCVRAGTLYGPEYVSRLQAAVARNLSVPHRFVCLTDRPNEVKCETLPMPLNLTGWGEGEGGAI